MSRRTKLLAAFAAVVMGLLALWALGPGTSEHEAARPGAAAPPAADPHAEPAPAREPSPYERAVARIDETLARLERQADAREDDWVVLERLAGGYLERQRLTGDWADFGRAEAAIARAFERAPAGAGPFLMRAQLSYTLHRLDRIEADLAAVEGFAVPQDEELRAVRVMRANVALQTGRYDEAAAAFDALLAEERSRDALIGLAGHRLATGAHAEADALLAEAEEDASGADPMARAWVCLVRGLVDLEAGAYEEALIDYRRGLERMPGWYLLEEHVAEAQAELGRRDEALTAYLDLIERTNDPEFMDAAAEIYEATGRQALADAMWTRAHAGHEARIEAFPTAAFGHALDHYLAHAPDAARAVELAERNRDVRPNGEAWTQLARAYLGAGRREDALAALAAVEAMPYRSSALDEVRAAIREAASAP